VGDVSGLRDGDATVSSAERTEAQDDQIRGVLLIRSSMLEVLGAETGPEALELEQLERSSLASALADVIREPDAAERARVLTSYLVDVQHLIDLLSGVRNEAIRELRTSRRASYDDVAVLLGISKSRAQQLCKRLESSS
jgi:hypothetical protein